MQEQNYIELGSEFWLENGQSAERIYVLSGRTAIDLILQDMMSCGQQIKSVYMPAYCCDSMLQPFIDNRVIIQLYDISYKEGKLFYDIDVDKKTDILYLNNYFGYDSFFPIDVIQLFRKKGTTIIYDRTHSLLREDSQIQALSDYTFASIRKWMGVPCGAFVSKHSGELFHASLKDCPYLKEKVEAMMQKGAYMKGDNTIDKQCFLNLYKSFNHHLAEDYRYYKIDDLSWNIWNSSDLQSIKRQRCKNATYLYSELEKVPQIKTLFTISGEDCPLFVPVIFETSNVRDDVRKFLTSKSIYCPIHWPKPQVVDPTLKVNCLYDRELSLLCDQRYGIMDMQRIVETIIDYFENKQ